MSDNKKYYYLKLKDNFYDSDEIKIIESMTNGYEYSSFYLKLCLMSLKDEGRLLFKGRIPYNSEMLSTITGHNIDVIKSALDIFIKMELIEIFDTGTIFMNDIQNFIGKGSSEAERKRLYRKRIEEEKKDNLLEMGQSPGQRPPEIEIEIEIEKEKNLKKQKNFNEEKNNFSEEINFFVSDFIKKVKLSYPTTSPKITGKTKYNYCDSVDKLIRIDGFKFPYIQKVILFAIEDSFLSQNIKSLANIRKKWKNDLTAFQNCVDKFEKNKKNERPQNHLGSAYQEWNGGKL